MCGIVGVVGRITADHERMFKTMLIFDVLRGEDSTGVFSVYQNSEVRYAKEVGDPHNLFRTEDFKKTMSGFMGALVGHNRAATKGVVSKENAHPFNFDNFIGVHNGTLRGQWRLDNSKDFSVDSENIYHHMNNNGVIETIKELEGAFTLAFYDKKAHMVRLVRNKERPLWYAFTEDKKTVVFASEPWMITIAAGRNNVKVTNPKEADVGFLMSFQVPDCDPSKFEGYEGKWLKEKVELFTYPVYTYNYGYKKDSNIIPFKRDAIYDMVGKVINFSVAGQATDGKSTKFIQAYEETSDQEIRIFMARSNQLYDRMIESNNLFRGKVLSIGSFNQKQFLCMENSTIEELSVEETTEVLNTISTIVETPENMPVYDNKKVTLSKWLDMTADGCAMCKQIPNASEASELNWWYENDFICKTCQAELERQGIGSKMN